MSTRTRSRAARPQSALEREGEREAAYLLSGGCGHLSARSQRGCVSAMPLLCVCAGGLN